MFAPVNNAGGMAQNDLAFFQGAGRWPPTLIEAILQDFLFTWHVVPHRDTLDRAQSRDVVNEGRFLRGNAR